MPDAASSRHASPRGCIPVVERRGGERVLCPPGVTLRTTEGQHVALINLSAGGCTVHAMPAYAPGDIETFELFTPKGRFDLSARVVHVTDLRTLDAPTQVVGLEFSTPLSVEVQRAVGIA